MNEKEAMEYIEGVVFAEDFVASPYLYSPESYNSYIRGVYICEQLKKEGLISFRADKINKPLTLHCLEVTWTPGLEIAELSSKQMGMVAELFGRFDSVIVDTRENLEWNFFIEIYSSGKVNEH